MRFLLKMKPIPARTNSFGQHLTHFKKTLVGSKSSSSLTTTSSESWSRDSTLKCLTPMKQMMSSTSTASHRKTLSSSSIAFHSSPSCSTSSQSSSASRYFKRPTSRPKRELPKALNRELYFLRDVVDDSVKVAKESAYYRAVRQ